MTTQVTLARLREFGITPDRELGQHFLIDSNVLEVAGRLIELEPADVVLEVGAGVGVLTDWLADRVATVHAVEIDRRLEPALRATVAGRPNVADRLVAMRSTSTSASSTLPPTAMVANLPYSVATPVVMNALPFVERFCVMVQREVADRFFAASGSKAYGAPSVLIQLACERVGMRKVSRKVFVPEPNVDSALVGFRRREGSYSASGWAWTSTVVHAAFAYRRKTLANAFALGGLPAPPADVAGLRAEQLEPERFAQLAEELR